MCLMHKPDKTRITLESLPFPIKGTNEFFYLGSKRFGIGQSVAGSYLRPMFAKTNSYRIEMYDDNVGFVVNAPLSIQRIANYFYYLQEDGTIETTEEEYGFKTDGLGMHISTFPRAKKQFKRYKPKYVKSPILEDGDRETFFYEIPVAFKREWVQMVDYIDIVVAKFLILLPLTLVQMFPHYPFAQEYTDLWGQFAPIVRNTIKRDLEVK